MGRVEIEGDVGRVDGGFGAVGEWTETDEFGESSEGGKVGGVANSSGKWSPAFDSVESLLRVYPAYRLHLVSKRICLGHNNNSMTSSRSRCSSSSSSLSPAHFVWYPGQLIKDRYRVRKLLGDGTFGRVLQVEDLLQNDQVYALKVIRAEARYVLAAKYEAEVLEYLTRARAFDASHVVRLVGHFTYGEHYCLLYEALGPTLYDVIKSNHYKGGTQLGFPMAQVQSFARQLLEAVDFLHLQRVVHTDIKLENVVLVSGTMSPASHSPLYPVCSDVKLIDFGGAVHYDEDRSCLINTRQYRAPEVILGTAQPGLPWNEKSDIWSLACVFSELYSGDLLFPAHDDYEHMAMIHRLCGHLPGWMTRESKSRFFDHHGRLDFPRHASDKQIRSVRKLALLEVYLDRIWYHQGTETSGTCSMRCWRWIQSADPRRINSCDILSLVVHMTSNCNNPPTWTPSSKNSQRSSACVSVAIRPLSIKRRCSLIRWGTTDSSRFGWRTTSPLPQYLKTCDSPQLFTSKTSSALVGVHPTSSRVYQIKPNSSSVSLFSR